MIFIFGIYLRYMNEVDKFFDIKETATNGKNNQQRCVYLATDEIQVINEAKSK
jgi:hypothetical protein